MHKGRQEKKMEGGMRMSTDENRKNRKVATKEKERKKSVNRDASHPVVVPVLSCQQKQRALVK